MEDNSVAVTVRPYAIAVISTAAATWIRSLLDPWLGSECPFSLFYLSVLLTAWLAGARPAILSLILGTLSAAHFFVSPEFSLFINEFSGILSTTIYVFVNCVAIGLFASLERRRNGMKDRLQDNERLGRSLKLADERKDEFLALLAHELRNPLAPLRSHLSRLEKVGIDGAVVDRVRIVCQRQVNQLVRLVDDLMDVSRFLRGNLQLQIQPVDLTDVVQAAIEMTEGLMIKKSQRFQSLLPSHPVWVMGDPVRITQLTANLLGNAAKYTPIGGRVLLQVELKHGIARIIVSDNGIGFPPGDCERILEPFTQIDTSRTREYGGLGLGLAIVQQIVKSHHGTILAESRGPGTGSQFTVTLPVASAEQSMLATLTPSLADPATQVARVIVARSDRFDSRVGEFQILIVEDNVDAAEALEELLTLEGFTVRAVHDPIAALKLIEVEVPAVILMDIGLPGMDGYELTRRIRSRHSASAIRIIALTGWGRENDREETRRAGFDHHLVKPINLADLLPLLQIAPTAVNPTHLVNSR